jgi:hypothetical protein
LEVWASARQAVRMEKSTSEKVLIRNLERCFC